MAVPQRCACQVIRSRISYTPTQGRFATPSTTGATQNIGFVGPMQLVGADSTPFSVDVVNGRGTIIVPFYNLPAWTRGHVLTIPNYLRPFHNQLRTKQTFIQPMNQLFFHAHPMSIVGPPNVRIDIAPRAIDAQNIPATGPFIGGGRSYRNWQAVVTATASKGFTGTVTGQAVGTLHHVFS